MVRLPSRKALEAMKRTDIQKLCKDYGVKANLKTEALIDLLQSINTPQPTREPPQPQPRKVSTRRSSRAGPSRTSSIVIHDFDGEDEEEEEQGQEELQEQEEVPLIPNPPPSRTRKAKETQLRLGVGRPKAAGGSGARAVTKSVSLSKGKRAKSSKTMKPSEAPIPEEAEEQDPPEPKHSSLGLELVTASPEPTLKPRSPTPAEPSAESAVIAETSAVQPLREQLAALHNEVERLKRDQQQVHVLQATLDILTTELDDLRGQTTEALSIANELRQAQKTPSIPRTPSPRSPRQEVPPAPHSISATTFAAIAGPSSKKGEPPCDPPSPTSRAAERGGLQHPGFALTTLGKRHRDSTTSNITGIMESEDDDIPEDELRTKVIRPMKKRLKTTRDSSTPNNATAAHPSLVPPLPYPEIGQSPTPAGLSRLGLGRPSTFQPFGRSPRADADEHQDGGAFVNPAALSTDNHRESSSSAGTPSAQTPGSSRTPQEPHPKPVTMYGTELEGDTRFGDFGVEGVASSGQMLPNFWTGGKF
ncbi:hypothetical protein PLEOSDRAFT_1082025 [Pleurotus ostreatus PC15]|uniref:Uncharacterized protein n=1 Tax=Pleurotus ostreatus (strain PC15) TaxID=1137138 RepID=A0A067NRT9_PLEO1|nr:hypothetical protein PLEOSDRAFT_1082025 [Pleurotus ostreatus PC15]